MTAQTYTESLLNDESATDGRSYNLNQVFTLTAQTYTESLLKDENPHDGSDSLYRALTLTGNSYNLHPTLTLITKRYCKDIRMNHPRGRL